MAKKSTLSLTILSLIINWIATILTYVFHSKFVDVDELCHSEHREKQMYHLAWIVRQLPIVLHVNNRIIVGHFVKVPIVAAIEV